MNTNMNYYEMLDVDRTATEAEIKKAYIRKIRIYSNETHPVEFQALTKAHKTLSDPAARKEYDKAGSRDPHYDRLLAEVDEQMGKENYYRAIDLCDEILRKYHKDADARVYKGYAFMNLNRIHEAHQVANRLRVDEPDNPEYLELSATIYFNEKNYYKASDLFNRLTNLEPNVSSYFLRLSNCYFHLGKIREATQALERKVSRGVTIDDYRLLSELYFGYVNQNDYQGSARALNQIKALPQNESEKRAVIELLIDDCADLSQSYSGFNDLIGAVRVLNNRTYADVNQWLDNIGRHDGNHARHEVNAGHQESAATTYDQSYNEVADGGDGRGSVLVSIIIGIIASIIFTPIVGIIVGFVYYFHAENIKAFLTCAVYIIIAIAIMGFFFF